MEKIRVLAADKLATEGLALLQGDDQLQVDVKTGLSEDQLAEIVGQYDGLIIRSGAKVTAKVLANPGRLKAIARAGVGVDNVDIPVATAAGILVMNTPDANTLSTAELTLALMLSMLRQIPTACVSLKKGEWERTKFTGRQVAGKTLGVLGLGRVGTALAARALALKMNVIGFDPFVTGGTILEGRVRLASSLAEMLPEVDVLTRAHAADRPDARDRRQEGTGGDEGRRVHPERRARRDHRRGGAVRGAQEREARRGGAGRVPGRAAQERDRPEADRTGQRDLHAAPGGLDASRRRRRSASRRRRSCWITSRRARSTRR